MATQVDDVDVTVAGGAGGGAGVAAEPSSDSDDDFAGDSKAGGTAFRKLKVLIVTWNVGNKKPPADLSGLLPAKGGAYDIIAVGAQESNYKLKKSKNKDAGADDGDDDADDDADAEADDASDDEADADAAGETKEAADMTKTPGQADTASSLSSNHFFSVIQEHVGNKFHTVELVSLWEMRLIVLARNELQSKIHHKNKGREATGALHVMANKGGLVVKFSVLGTTLCFVSCHLAAHQGKSLKRNENVSEIVEGIHFDNTMLDIDSQFHHCFWLGDLNYRIDLGIVDGKPHEHDTHVEEVKALIAAKKWKELMQADQLRYYQRAGKVFCGFQEGEYTFSPTFKVQREPGFNYKTQRVPSYCDRVMWKSLPGRKSDVRLASLKACPTVGTSDHKPVQAGFELLVRKKLDVVQSQAMCPQLVLTDVKGHDLKVADARTSDPYLTFFGDPVELLAGKGGKAQRTKHKSSTVNPVWSDQEMPKLRLHVPVPEQLKRCTVMIAVTDYDALSADDGMGQAILGLEAIVKAGKPVPFNLPVVHNSAQFGRLTGTAEIVWPNNPGFNSKSHVAHDSGSKGCCTVQ